MPLVKPRADARSRTAVSQDLAEPVRAKASGRRRKVDGFEQRGLAVPVVSRDHIEPLGRNKLRIDDIAKIANNQALEVQPGHLRSITPHARRGRRRSGTSKRQMRMGMMTAI